MTPAKLQALKPWLLTGLGALVAAFYLFPVYWMVSSALKTSNEVNAAIPTLWPSDPTLAAFRWIFERENVGRYLYNSLIISVGTTALTLLLATGAAYALSRVRSMWMDAVLIGVMLSQVLPPPLLVTPMFVIFRQLDLVNTYTAVILATTSKTLPFAVIMLRTTFAQIPIEIEEAARVDGATPWQSFWRVLLPMALPILMVVFMLAFIGAIIEYPVASVLLSEQDLLTLAVGSKLFVQEHNFRWGDFAAAAILSGLPITAVFLLAQRWMIAGLASGGVKG